MKVKLLLKDGTTMDVEDVVSYSIYTAAPPPTEGIPFEVNYKGIDKSLFEMTRSDVIQEKKRQSILEAFAEAEKNPQRYANPFCTLIPKRDRRKFNTIQEMGTYAYHLGGHIANWVEQGLEWGQRISNGESWESLCNHTDSAKWYRVIKWKDDLYLLVGGSYCLATYDPAAAIHNSRMYCCHEAPMASVPLIAFGKK